MKQIDVSEYPPCEPLEITLKELDGLKNNEKLKVIHRQIPYPLFTILEKRGFSYTLKEIKEDLFHIIIQKNV